MILILCYGTTLSSGTLISLCVTLIPNGRNPLWQLLPILLGKHIGNEKDSHEVGSNPTWLLESPLNWVLDRPRVSKMVVWILEMLINGAASLAVAVGVDSCRVSLKVSLCGEDKCFEVQQTSWIGGFNCVALVAPHQDIRFVALMWSLSSLRNRCLSGIWRGIVVKNGHYKDTFYKEIGLYSENIDTILGLIINTIERVYVFTYREISKHSWQSLWFAIAH